MVLSRLTGSRAAWREKLNTTTYVVRLLRMLFGANRTLAVTSALLRFVNAAFPLAQLSVARLIIDQLIAIVAHQSPSGRLWSYVGLEVALFVLSDVCVRVGTLCESLLSDEFSNQVSVRLVRHVAKLDLRTFEECAFQDALERARRHSTGRLSVLVSAAGICQLVLGLVSLSIALISFSPVYFALMLLAMAPALAGESKSAELAYSALYRTTPTRRRLDYLRYVGATLDSAKEVRLLGLGEYLAARMQSLFDSLHKVNRGVAVRRAVIGFSLNLLLTGIYYLAYVIVVGRALGGFLTIGDVTFLLGAFSRSRTMIEQIVSSLGSIGEQSLYLRDMFQVLETKPAMGAGPTSIPAPRPIQRGLEFRNVSFAYPQSNRPVVRDISFRLDTGERLALVGENGAGKTTIVKLMTRLYSPTAGSILLDGVDLHEYDLTSLSKEICVLFQDYMRYHLSVRENIGLGKVDSMDCEAAIQNAARKGLAAPFIAKLPRSYDQMLGKSFDDGVDLSDGQWQKMALARTHMRNAQIVILDEPTASLDPKSECEVFTQFFQVSRATMTVLISHRLSTARMADRIIVLADGRIEEKGSHDELLTGAGRYAEMFRLQAAGYR